MEPMIKPKIAKNVASLNFFKQNAIILDPIKSPNKIPRPTGRSTNKFKLCIALMTLLYIPKTNIIKLPLQPGNIKQKEASIPTTKNFIDFKKVISTTIFELLFNVKLR